MGDVDKDLGVQGMAEGNVALVGGRRVDMEVVSFGIQLGVEVRIYNAVGNKGVLQMEHTDVSGAELVRERSEEVRRCGKKWRVCPEVEKV